MSAAKPTILYAGQLRVIERGGGARTTPLVTRQVGAKSLINGITAFDPGASIAVHKHNCEESVIVLEGEAIVEIDGVSHRAAANDTVWIPADIPHRFINASADKPMRIFWTYASIDATRTIIATGETRAIDVEQAG